MVVINPERMLTVTEARPKLHATVADAQKGLISHILLKGQIVAHVVPVATYIIDDAVALRCMVSALIANETTPEKCRRRFPDQGRFTLDGEASCGIIRLLAWAWRTDPAALFTPILRKYVDTLTAATAQTLTLPDIEPGLTQGLTTSALTCSEANAALAYAHQHWHSAHAASVDF